ncbi:MAG: PUA domain-containing protein [Candidatus Woesearchaeota archaeon]
MKQVPLSKSQIKELSKACEPFGLEFSKKDLIILVDNIYYFKEKKCILFLEDNTLYPTLHAKPTLPIITVDRGAVPYVVKGADIMRPGIVSTQEFEKNDLILICDHESNMNLAIGKALFSQKEITDMQKGKVIKMIHYYGDSIYRK